MSAWTRARPKHITDYVALLEILDQASRRTQELVLPMEMQDYRLREILAACDRYPEVAGRYAGLGQRVEAKLKVVQGRQMLVVRSRLLTGEGLNQAMSEADDEADLVRQLAEEMKRGEEPAPSGSTSPFDLIRRPRHE